MNGLQQTGNLLRLYWRQERANFQFTLFNAFIYPATLGYLGWMMLAGDLEAVRWWMAGSLTIGLGMSGLAQVGFGVIMDRFQGRLDLLRCQPLSKGAYYSAHIGVATLTSVISVSLGMAVLALLGAASPTLAAISSGVLIAAAAGSAIGGLAALLAFRARDFDLGNTMVAMTALGLGFVSPVFYEIDALPALLQPLAWLSPFTGVAALLRTVLAGEAVPLGMLAWVLVLSLAFHAVSLRWLRWQS